MSISKLSPARGLQAERKAQQMASELAEAHDKGVIGFWVMFCSCADLMQQIEPTLKATPLRHNTTWAESSGARFLKNYAKTLPQHIHLAKTVHYGGGPQTIFPRPKVVFKRRFTVGATGQVRGTSVSTCGPRVLATYFVVAHTNQI